MEKYDESITYFTKAHDIDPENPHILIKKAITYYILEKYDKALLNLDKAIQIDSINNLAYYYEGIIYYMMENNSGAVAAFKKCIELNSNYIFADMLFYCLKDLLDGNVIKELNQINNDKSLFYNLCPNVPEVFKDKYFSKKEMENLIELNDIIN